MKLSRYVVKVTDDSDVRHVTLFSTLTRAVIRVPKTVLAAVEAGTMDPASSCAQVLLQRAMLVDDGLDELSTYRFWSCRNRYNPDKLQMTLILTYACNCACKYCYEVGVRTPPGSPVLDLGMAQRITEWIERYVRTVGTRHIDLCYHGGEPTLNMEAIRYIGPKVGEICRDHGITCFQSIVTNGTLLSPTNLEQSVDAGVQFAMVTLDGPPAVHDARRPYLSGRGTFQVVLDNIRNAASKLKVYLLMNVDRHNCGSAAELADILAATELRGRLHGVMVAFVEPTRPMTDHCCMYDMPRSELAVQNAKVSRAFADRGFPVRDLLQLGFCTMNVDHAFVVDPNGDIYKCITGVGDHHFRMGHIDDHLNVLAVKASQFVENDPCSARPECLSCPYLPMCKGGCRHESYVRYDDATKGICMFDYFQAWIPNVIREFYGPASYGDHRAKASVWAAPV